jgi:hypothetical protein
MTISSTPKILLLAHDLSDAAIKRRIEMLRAGGALITVAGFRRGDEPIHNIAGSRAIDFGRTYNVRFVQRCLSVLRESFLLARHKSLFTDADIIIARNLEMLAIGVRGRSLCKAKPLLIYECLDIHRLIVGSYVERPPRQELFQTFPEGAVRSCVRPFCAVIDRWPR